MLNRPLRCVQELSEFDVAMGWAFRDLSVHDDQQCYSPDQDDLEREHREHKRREHTHTAFDERVEIPREFVAPVAALRTKQASQSSHKKTKKTAASAVHSAAYSKRPTSKNVPAKPPPKPVAKSRARSRSRSPERQEEVDFVYDVDTRRKLRERMDAERIETLHKAEEKEAKLRVQHKWVGDGRKQAWQTTSPASSPDKPRRVMSAGSSASRTSSATTGKATKVLSSKTAIAPNISEWRTQEFPVYASAETQYAQRRREDAQRQTQQRRDARDVAHTIDLFEQNLKQWTS